ncbi:hypothetical protein KZZ04_04810 [Pseudoalteromonas sp. CR1]|uniref:hypothetical protein n=1 Tax=Pseudoalteromonas sp. CR1 TaxID=2861964 RepID=UPI001C5FD993|nr:hypothetical protein [Pseudoalteromonas sp. CR1]MBW4965686.1 hypothetical protein [Pseudoalteromonas sp. CR1]
MQKIIKLTFVILTFSFLGGCASTLKPTELQSVKTVGIINQFPDTPNFVTIGTTIFNNEYAQINDPNFSKLLTDTVVKRLENKGFQARLIDEAQRPNFDMIIELIPRDVYATPGTYGYGVNQRSAFGNAMQANTYMALNIAPYIEGKKKCSACYLQKLMPINIEELPATWNELSDADKQHVSEVLNKNIELSINEILMQTGL